MKRNATGRWLDAAAERIERAGWLDRWTELLSPLAEPLRSSRRLTDLLSGTPIGHPVHPLLVTVPIGSWTGACLLDVLGQRAAARTMVGLGVLAAVPSALSGLSDWNDTAGGERRVGVVHAAANSGVLGLYAASWLARRAGRHRLGQLLTVPALSLISVSGWLGGHLIYARGVGVDTTAFDDPESAWVDAAEADQVETGRLTVVDVLGTPVLLTRARSGELVAYADRCTHRGGPLHEGPVITDEQDRSCVECPWHGSRFALDDGSVVAGPATRPQPRYEVRLDGGRVLVRRPEHPHALRANPA